MRTNFAQEFAIREAIEKAIKEAALKTQIVYPLPSTIVEVLWEQGISVTKPTIINRYKEMGIVLKDGLWVKA